MKLPLGGRRKCQIAQNKYFRWMSSPKTTLIVSRLARNPFSASA